MKIIPILRKEYNLIVEEGGSREYPDITLKRHPNSRKLLAIDIKTARLEGPNTISGFTLGSYGGYFLHPERKEPGIKYPYSWYCEHIITGVIYKWDEKVPTEDMVKIVQVIVHPKWKIASKSTGTGATTAIRSVKELRRLIEGKGDFGSKDEFERYWREKGLKRKRR